jgi:hypothetical protein
MRSSQPSEAAAAARTVLCAGRGGVRVDRVDVRVRADGLEQAEIRLLDVVVAVAEFEVTARGW